MGFSPRPGSPGMRKNDFRLSTVSWLLITVLFIVSASAFLRKSGSTVYISVPDSISENGLRGMSRKQTALGDLRESQTVYNETPGVTKSQKENHITTQASSSGSDDSPRKPPLRSNAAFVDDWHDNRSNLTGPRRPLWWHAPFFSTSGYGNEARHYMLSLLETKIMQPEDLWVSHHGDQWGDNYYKFLDHDTSDNLLSMMQLRLENELNRNRMETAVVVCHSLPPFWAVLKGGSTLWRSTGRKCPPSRGKGAYIIGRTMSETDKITKDWVEICNRMDEVWVPSEFHKQSFAESGVEAHKLVVVAEGINTTLFDPVRYTPAELPKGNLLLGKSRTTRLLPKDANLTIMLSVFKWERRKGWDILLDAYLQEFEAGDPVELYIITKVFDPRATNFLETVQGYVRKKLGPEVDLQALPAVYLISDDLPETEFPRFYLAANMIVQPTRGEGWGRPQVEAMSMARPVISTNWSGITAFLSEEVGYPLAINGLVDTQENSSDYFKGMKWAEPSVSHLRELMRHVMLNPEEAENKAKKARQLMVDKYSNPVIAREVGARLNWINKKLNAGFVHKDREELEKKKQKEDDLKQIIALLKKKNQLNQDP